jgi:hypothetical protein
MSFPSLSGFLYLFLLPSVPFVPLISEKFHTGESALENVSFDLFLSGA